MLGGRDYFLTQRNHISVRLGLTIYEGYEGFVLLVSLSTRVHALI